MLKIAAGGSLRGAVQVTLSFRPHFAGCIYPSNRGRLQTDSWVHAEKAKIKMYELQWASQQIAIVRFTRPRPVAEESLCRTADNDLRPQGMRWPITYTATAHPSLAGLQHNSSSPPPHTARHLTICSSHFALSCSPCSRDSAPGNRSPSSFRGQMTDPFRSADPITTLNSAERSAASAAAQRIQTAYTTVAGVSAFASALDAAETQFWATQTVVSGADSTESTLAPSQVSALGYAFEDVVVDFVATQTFVTGTPRESLVRDFQAVLKMPGAAPGRAAAAAGTVLVPALAVGVAAGAGLLL